MARKKRRSKKGSGILTIGPKRGAVVCKVAKSKSQKLRVCVGTVSKSGKRGKKRRTSSYSGGGGI